MIITIVLVMFKRNLEIFIEITRYLVQYILHRHACNSQLSVTLINLNNVWLFSCDNYGLENNSPSKWILIMYLRILLCRGGVNQFGFWKNYIIFFEKIFNPKSMHACVYACVCFFCYRILTRKLQTIFYKITNHFMTEISIVISRRFIYCANY